MTVGTATNVKTEGRLKPCPFCGGTELSIPTHAALRWAQCENYDCRMEGPLGGTTEEAIAAWNARAAPPEDDPEPPKDDEDQYGPDREETDDR